MFDLANFKLKSDIDDNDWQSMKNDTELMLNQGIICGGFNYRHGSVYFTPSKYKAKQYAVTNKYGSELISHCYEFYKFINGKGISIPNDLLNDNKELFGIFNKKGLPVLIEVKNMRVQYLRTEQGKNIDEQLLKIKKIMDIILTNYRKDKELFEKVKKGDPDAIKSVILSGKKSKDLPKNEIEAIEKWGNIHFQETNIELIGILKQSAFQVDFIKENECNQSL